MTTFTAADMQAAIYSKYVSRAAVLFEISSDARDDTRTLGDGTVIPWKRARRIDVLTVQTARKRGLGPLDLMAIEIKVSRADFLADIRQPAKQAPWREIAHRHAYAAPEGLISPGEVPDGSGLLTVGRYGNGQYRVEWARKAPYGETPEIPAWLTLSLAWRMSAAEAKTRGLAWGTRDLGESAEELRGALVKARAELETLRGQRDRAKSEAGQWRKLAATGSRVPCAHCGKPVRPVSVRKAYPEWRHADNAHDDACSVIRQRLGRWVDIEPADPLPDPPETP